MVPEVGLEPTRHCWQRILSPQRLPFRHSGTLKSDQVANHEEYRNRDNFKNTNFRFGGGFYNIAGIIKGFLLSRCPVFVSDSGRLI